MKVSIVIPTFQRPDFLERCVRSLFVQTRLPDEIVLVSRGTDEATNAKIGELQQELGGRIPIRNPRVNTAGFLPPVKRGIEEVTGDVTAFLDDDAEAFPDWLERILNHYRAPDVGGVGGRIVNYVGTELIPYEPASKVAYLSWYGRSVGNMYKELTFDHPVNADFFMGGNMSFRTGLLKKITIDPVLNTREAYLWELDVAQQIKLLAGRLIFDPLAKANHYNAPRGSDCQRVLSEDAVITANFNTAYLMMKHLPTVGKFAYVMHSLFIGCQGAPGVVYLILQTVRRKPYDWEKDVWASLKGRAMGVMAYMGRSTK